MFLKSLQMQGFKSFPDKTTINFNSGITAIVGPNGSGKSNITDAVRWVLGEMSSKMLRGTKMEDVIFDGTASRKAMGFAEVSLTLDNSDKSLPVDFSEVTVTRRYYRSGDSEYMINRNPVRLKDIHELLMDTGLGRDGYSIIGQGKIADILASKSDERRQIFEEAAGISKYRYRKIESERRLEQTQDNLTRIRDILAELEERVEPLAKQAEMAREYLALREEKKGLEVSIWLNNIDNISTNRAKVAQECETARSSLDMAEQEIGVQEARLEETYASVQNFTTQVDVLRGEIAEITEQVAAKENEIALLRRNIEYNDEMIARLGEDMAEDDQRMQAFNESIAQKNAQIAQHSEHLASEQTALQELSESSAAVFSRENDLEHKISALNNEVLTLSEQLTDAKIKAGYAESNCTVLGQNFERIAAQLEQAKADKTELMAEIDRFQTEVTATGDKITELGNSLTGYNLRIDTFKVRIDKQAKIRAELEKNINEKQLRLTTLGDMQNHYDGYYDSVKSIMTAATRGQLRGVCGPVSTIVRTADKYSMAIETALGNQIQNIVVDTDADAKSAVYYLKNNNAGRATFLPVSTISGKPLSDADMKDSLGYIGIAAEMVQYDPKFKGIVDWLLGRVCIVCNLENAVSLAQKIGYRYRIVTLDGQIVNAGGSMTGGSAVKGSGLLLRQNEMTRLEKELKVHNEEFATVCAALEELEDKYARDCAYADGLKAEIRENEDRKATATLRLEDARVRQTNADALVGRLKEMDDKAHAEQDAARAALEEYTALAEKLTGDVDARTSEANELLKGHEEIIARRDELAGRMSEIKLNIYTIEKDIETAKQSIEELKAYYEERVALNDTRIRECETLKEKNLQTQDLIAASETAVESFRQDIAARQAQIERNRLDRENAEKSVTGLRAEIKDATTLKEKLIREVERFETRRDSIESEYENIVLRLLDEYELTLTEAQPLRIELESVSKAQQRVGEIKGKIKRMGDVNVGAIEEYKIVKERYDFLTGQTNDLLAAKEDIEKIIADLTEKMRTIFAEQFTVINETFQQTFVELFGGGTASLSLTDPNDLLTTGIDIHVTPPGKVIKNLSSLSGGEQAFVAIALYFAILRVRPTPFCIMDEIETALDEVNTARFAGFLRTITATTQLIVVTHRRSTMEEADVLYGVTMQEKGVSKLLTINVGDVYNELGIQ